MKNLILPLSPCVGEVRTCLVSPHHPPATCRSCRPTVAEWTSLSAVGETLLCPHAKTATDRLLLQLQKCAATAETKQRPESGAARCRAWHWSWQLLSQPSLTALGLIPQLVRVQSMLCCT